jgi:DNA-binding response OmpR family regulator
MAESILVVEDDPSLSRGLQMSLDLEGFRVVLARDGEEALRLSAKHMPDVILMDLVLPRKPGHQVIRELRAIDTDTPIIVLSARDQEGDKVLSLSLGADDYVVKPFGMAELVARIRAALRRRRRSRREWRAGPIAVDLDEHRILRDGSEVEATAREFALLAFLISHPGLVFTREQLIRNVWGADHFGTPRTVDNFVARLRDKLERDPAAPQHLVTVRGVGYRFVP